MLIHTLPLTYTVFITTLPVRHHTYETIRRAPRKMTTFSCQVKTVQMLPIITNSTLPLENWGDTSSMKTDGISKKILLADTFSIPVNEAFGQTYYNWQFIDAWIASILFTMQIYFNYHDSPYMKF